MLKMLMTRIETGLESILRYDGHDEDNDENLFWRAFWEECVNIVSGLDQININITIFTSIYIDIYISISIYQYSYQYMYMINNINISILPGSDRAPATLSPFGRP